MNDRIEKLRAEYEAARDAYDAFYTAASDAYAALDAYAADAHADARTA